MVVILIIIGALLGAAVNEGTGVLLGGFVGWLFWRSLRQQREIDALRKSLEHAEVAAGPASSLQPAVAAEELTPRPIAEPAEAAAAEAAVPAEAAGASRQPLDTADATTMPMPSAPPLPPRGPQAPPAPGFVDGARQWLFGGNTIVKAGIGILFIGLAFLAKYASEHVSLPIEFRLAAIAATAVVLLGLGWRLREKRAAYAQVLQGGAVAVLYLTLFTAHRHYDVIGLLPAFAMMVLIAALAAALALLQRAQVLAVIGALGGFATPLLLSTGGGNIAGLFAYYLVLDLGIAAVAWWATWRWLNLIGFAFTFGVGTLWGVFDYKPEQHAMAQAFLVVFFLTFIAILLMPVRRVDASTDGPAEPQHHRWVNGSLLFGLPTVVFGLQYGLVRHTEYGAALSALVLAAFYVGVARWLHAQPRLRLAFEGCLAVGTIFLTLVIPFALEPRAVAGAWALEGAGLVWLGWRQARRLARALGYLLLLVAGFLLLHAIERHAMPTTLINPTLLGGLMWWAGALIAACSVQRLAPPGPALQSERIAEPVLIGWSLLAAAVTVWLHVFALVPPTLRLAALIAGVSVVALLYTGLAARLAWRGAALPVLALAPLLLLATAASAEFQREPFTQGGWWAWPIALAVHAATLRWAAPHWPARGVHLVHALGALVVATLGAIAGRSGVQGWGDAGSAWPWLGWLAVPALLLLLSGPALLRRWPVNRAPEAYQRSAAGVLAVVMLLWTLAANVASNGAAAPLPYLPLLNPLDLGIALALFAAWHWAAGPGGHQLLAQRGRLTLVLLGGCAFVWLNAMLVRGFHHFGGVPFRFDAWSSSLAVQTGLTLLWTATALPLMWWAARRAQQAPDSAAGQRAPWMVGAALLGLVVAKLLLVDLSGSGTVTRIVSFIGAGVLMLLIGYLAPLPGKGAADAKA